MPWSTLLIHAGMLSLLLTTLLVIIGLHNPRIMLQDYPKSIQVCVPPKTSAEKKLAVTYGIFFVLIMVGYPLVVLATAQITMSFSELMKSAWIILSVTNLYDLLILDWLVVCTLRPKIVVLPGTENNPGYRDYKFHFIGFLKGVVIMSVLSAIIAGFIWLVR